MAINKLSRVEIVRRCKPVILWIGLVTGVGLVAALKKRRLNTLHKESAMAANKPSRIEIMKRYNLTILWVCLVAASILLSMLALALNTSWDNASWNWWKILLIPLVLVSVVLIAIILLGYHFKWDWTGVSGYIPPNKEYQRAKTLWDWLQLLIIPVAIAGVGGVISGLHYQNDQHIAQEQRQDEILKIYLDNMQDLIVNHNLRKSGDNDPIRNVARAQTIVALERLDDYRYNKDDKGYKMKKGRLLQFLHESQLINKTHGVISMSSANLIDTDMGGARMDVGRVPYTNLDLSDDNLSDLALNNADLSYVVLDNTDLHNTGLNGAHLNGAILVRADLSNAYMYSTDLSNADLEGANLHGAVYNTKRIPMTDEQGNPITIQPTQWPKNVNPKARGAICVDCEKS